MLRVFLIQYPTMQLGSLAALLHDMPGLSSAPPTLRASVRFFPQFPLHGLVGLVALPKVVQEILSNHPGYLLDTLDNGMLLAAVPLDLTAFLSPLPVQDKTVEAQFQAAVASAITALDAAALRSWKS